MIETQDYKETGSEERRRAPSRIATRLSQPAVWALLDQVIVSLGNFVTNIAIARLTDPDTYGRFAIYLAAILVVNSLHAALIVYPLSMGISTEESTQGQKSILTCSLFFTSAACGILAVCVIPFLSIFAEPK